MSKWTDLKDWLEVQSFPEEKFSKLTSDGKYSPEKGETHSVDNEHHSLQTYEIEDPLGDGYSIVWWYNFCPTCQKVRNKRATLLDNNKWIAYQKWYVRKGEAIKSKEEEKSETLKQLNTKIE